MKELNELTERMDGADELMDSIVKKVTEIDKREIKITDYTPHFEALKQIFEAFLFKYNKESEALKAVIGQLNINYPAEQIKNTIAESKGILEAIRKALPVKVKHQFDYKTKGWIIAGMILLIVTSISTGLCGHLWIENNRLQAVDVKYRLLQQVDTSSTRWADSIYTSNPDEAEKTVIRMENEKVTKDKPSKIKISKRRKESKKRLR
ncbi:hypothetical protein DIU31_025310 [Mucilaginibacter rubeus]|uniref:Uncharacterized protein n=1 Tax=Mucilaginibacter rubeus TaxID=2027860 RepID=A0AAE6MKP3_9SPHI|nr:MULTISPECIES: hypothetical protein [Mucilaginibacter]QEM06664.1 hypothetical protein DIU31_025310 [Mucilaginibacter rubeus]QEM19253.1 hypothetical protein DIU38_025575 [Mucilaginibacter gossypii]QTE44201.1 hypothetical protein J3L19_02125 [Mucilaginibacter rubeus]QTE50802.1 hypothetical protein J3L21_02110 [Mucilaginibacter rubeus]QTE55885.1 hypothetical protein J3L23_27345 [Mucilaginibacter rubeus]